MLIGNNNTKLHDPLPRNKRKTFTDSVKTCVIKRDKVTTTVEISRNILGELLSFSAKGSKPIYFNVALTYPLSAIPLSIALPDGTRRETPKSKLMEVKSATTEPSTPYEMFGLKEDSPSQEWAKNAAFSRLSAKMTLLMAFKNTLTTHFRERTLP